MNKTFGRCIRVISSILLAVCLCFTESPTVVLADKSTEEKLNDAKKQKSETEKNLKSAEGELNSLNKRQDSLDKELNELNVTLFIIGDKLSDLEDQITVKEDEISEAQRALDEAISIKDAQYEAMKKRIQFIYEDSKTLYLDMMLGAKSFADFITVNSYIDSLAEYDERQYDEYTQNCNNVETLKQYLSDELSELNVLYDDVEAEQALMMQSIYETQGKISEYDDLIDEAEAQALEYERKLSEDKAAVQALEKQLAEEIRLSKLAQGSYKRDISEVTFAEGDRYLLANLIYCEAGGEPYEGQLAVGAVVLNRVMSSVFPDTVSGVIYQRSQFSPASSGRLAAALAANRANESCYKAADEAMAGTTNVGNSVFFRTPVPGLSGVQIGHHIFY